MAGGSETMKRARSVVEKVKRRIGTMYVLIITFSQSKCLTDVGQERRILKKNNY